MNKLEKLKPCFKSCNYIPQSDFVGDLADEILEIGERVYFLYKRYETPFLARGIISRRTKTEFTTPQGILVAEYRYDLEGFVRDQTHLPYGLNDLDRTMEGLFAKMKFGFENQFVTTDFTKNETA